MSILEKRVEILKLLLLVLIFMPIAASVDSIYDVKGDFKVDNTHDFIFINQTEVNDAALKLKSPDDRNLDLSMSVNNNNRLNSSVNADFFTEKGVYNFYFELDGNRTPTEGYHSIYIGAGNQTRYNEFLDFAGNRPSEDPFCAEEDDFSCEYEHFQASMMLKATEAYFLTGNSSFREEALNFSTKAYGSDFQRLTCRHTRNDFDCTADDSGQFDVSGAKRQGSLIDALWSVYAVTGNSTVRDLAKNYTQGSADECDVWSNDFDCKNGENQGYMASGYWKAYEVTGNNVFKDIAQNLTSTNHTHSRVAMAAARGYRLTQNNSYLGLGKDSYQRELEKCGENCSSSEKLELAVIGLEGYEATNNHGFYMESLLLEPNKSKKCYNGSEGICQYPDKQYYSTSTSASSYMAFKDEEKKFYNPIVTENPSNNQTLSISVELTGLINNSRAVLLDSGKNRLAKCRINVLSNTCEFDHGWQDQQVYYVVLESETLSYPSGAIPVTYTQKDPEIVDNAELLINGVPNSSCDPNDEDYTCVVSDERSQTEYISAYSQAYSYTKNKTYRSKLESLSLNPYHYNKSEDYRAQCLPDQDPDYDYYNLYSCTTFDGISGGQKQGSLIASLFESYSLSNNQSIKELGQKYASNSVNDTEDCQVWQDDYQCRDDSGSSASQGEMIRGYWTAYRVTGNETYQDIAENLVLEAFNQPNSYELAHSMWQTHTMTGNETHAELAKNMTEEIHENNSCLDNQCDIEEYIDQGHLLRQAYKASGNQSYRDKLSQHLEQRSNFECINTGNCLEPRIQGKAISFMTESAYTMPLEIGIERSIEVHSTEVTIGETVEAVCEAENTLEDSVIPDLSLTVSSSPELGNESFNYSIGDLEYNETNTTTNEFVAESEGSAEITCEYTSPELVRSSSATVDIVAEETEEEEEDVTEGEESETPPPSGAAPPEFEPEVIDYQYSDQEYGYTDFNLNQSYQYFEFYSKSCISAQRILREEETVLTINQTCTQEPDLIVQDIFNQTDSRTEKVLDASRSSEINYLFESRAEHWDKPKIALFNETSLDLQITSNLTSESKKDVYLAEFELSRPQQCTVQRNEEVISQDNSLKQTHNISLAEGENQITIDCEEASRSFTVEHQLDEQDSISPLILFILKLGSGGLLLASLISMIYYRNTLIGSVRIKIFDYYFDRVMNSVQAGDTDAAVSDYKRMTKFCDFPTTEDPELAAREGIKMYMMIDLVSDAGTELEDFNLVGDVKSSLGRYLAQNPDTLLARHIREKIRNMEVD